MLSSDLQNMQLLEVFCNLSYEANFVLFDDSIFLNLILCVEKTVENLCHEVGRCRNAPNQGPIRCLNVVQPHFQRQENWRCLHCASDNQTGDRSCHSCRQSRNNSPSVRMLEIHFLIFGLLSDTIRIASYSDNYLIDIHSSMIGLVRHIALFGYDVAANILFRSCMYHSE